MRPAWVTALRRNRRRVTAWCCGPTAVGAMLVAAVREWALLLGVTAAGAVVSVAVAACMDAMGDAQSGGGAHRDWLPTAGTGLLALWSVFSLVLLPMTWGWALLMLLLLGVLCGAVSVWRAERRLVRDLEQSLDIIDLAYCPRQRQHAVITDTPTDDLVDIWQKTGAGFSEQADARSTTGLCYVELRRLILDELESRDPQAFAWWLVEPDVSDMRRYTSG